MIKTNGSFLHTAYGIRQYYVFRKEVMASTNWIIMHFWLPCFLLIFLGNSSLILLMIVAGHVNVNNFVIYELSNATGLFSVMLILRNPVNASDECQ